MPEPCQQPDESARASIESDPTPGSTQDLGASHDNTQEVLGANQVEARRTVATRQATIARATSPPKRLVTEVTESISAPPAGRLGGGAAAAP